MAEETPADLPSIYEDYLATLDPSDRAEGRRALGAWNGFLEGRLPGEVDGQRREWFELSLEEQGLGVAAVLAHSEQVGRFYAWLARARPRQIKASGAQAKPTPSVDATLPPPPPALAGQEKLWVQGPSVGPPPPAGGGRALGKPVGLRQRAGEAGKEWDASPAASGAGAFRRYFLPLALVLAALWVIASYLLVLAPERVLESDIETYIEGADAQQIRGFYRWLLARAEADGFELDLGHMSEKWSPPPGTGARRGPSRFHYLDLRIPGTHRVLGLKRDVIIEVRALSEHRPPPWSPAPSEVSEPSHRPPASGERRSSPRPTPEEALRLKRVAAALRTAIENYRQTAERAPKAASELLLSEVDALREELERAPEDSRARVLLLEVADRLGEMARAEVELRGVEDRLFELEIRLREAERYVNGGERGP